VNRWRTAVRQRRPWTAHLTGVFERANGELHERIRVATPVNKCPRDIAAVHLAVKGVECSIGLLHDSANDDGQRGIARTVQNAGRREPQAEGAVSRLVIDSGITPHMTTAGRAERGR